MRDEKAQFITTFIVKIISGFAIQAAKYFESNG
jgi:hypothetical protein